MTVFRIHSGDRTVRTTVGLAMGVRPNESNQKV